jgi:hypothetical protein
LTNAIAATGCKASETQCICTSETFMPGVMECVEKSCVEADQACKSHIDLLKFEIAG